MEDPIQLECKIFTFSLSSQNLDRPKAKFNTVHTVFTSTVVPPIGFGSLAHSGVELSRLEIRLWADSIYLEQSLNN